MAMLWPTDSYGLFDVNSRNVTVNLVQQRIAAPDSTRVGLIVAVSTVGGANTVRIAPRGTIAASQGFTVLSGQPFMLSHLLWGPLPSLEWFANSAAGPVDIEVIELFLARHPSLSLGG